MKDNDVVTIRQYPSSFTAFIITVGIALGVALIYEGIKFIKNMIKEGLEAKSNSAKNQTTNYPTISGGSNQSALGKTIPLICGKTLFTPYVIGMPYTTIGGTDGKDVYFHCLYLIGYKDIQVKNIKLGIYELASNQANVENGAITIDGEYYDPQAYNIGLELKQNDSEVSLYPQKVVETDYNVELTNNDSGALKCYGFSAKYPQKMQVEIQFNGLIGYTDEGKPKSVETKVSLQMSIDGGNTWVPFGYFAGCSSHSTKEITIDGETSMTEESVFTRQKNEVMRFVSERVFTWEEKIKDDRSQETCLILLNYDLRTFKS